MNYQTISYDLDYIINLIDRGKLNLNPDFQRMERWNLKKKQLFIDSLLRGWPIQGIVLIENNFSLEVLDGQQRLTTIYDFLNNKIKINGKFAPYNDEIFDLDGLYFSMLNKSLQAEIFSRTLVISIISETELKNAPEFFARFNSPSPLQKNEKINAFEGITKNQVQDISYMVKKYLGSYLSFSNNRGVMDDVVVKIAYYFDTKESTKKLTVNILTDLYRQGYEISYMTIKKLKESIEFLSYVFGELYFDKKLSKVDFFSILMFTTCYDFKKDSSGTRDYIMKNLMLFINQKFTIYDDIEDNYYLFKKHSVQGTITPNSIQMRQWILFNLGKNKSNRHYIVDFAKEFDFTEDFCYEA
ncbi:DUF262 domain-containing protein [Listeria booriae]|uniref:DUF262 domain-containing protein n=1 Tax=Listeria booriae TaxID=1552123 RepID=A0A842F4R2_9LIST|nr:DUF262 domain-containing protein [Listeria booriae]MBC2242335.1 DUF262 domain-containing protein [Listeria booriae]